ncbi:MAG: hypothetical protein WBA07_01735 [Rivularia sp. (in: cyanobacteria)]
MTFPQIQEFLETAEPMKMYLHLGEKPSEASSTSTRRIRYQSGLMLPALFSHLNLQLMQSLCETGHGEFHISSQRKNHEIVVYLGSHISYQYSINPQQLEPIDSAYRQVIKTWNQWYSSE